MNYINYKKINGYLLLLLIVAVFHVYPNKVQSAVKVNVTAKGLSSNDGLVGWWTFDGKNISNGVIRDTSGNGNNANTINISSSTFYSIGKIGQAVNLDGSDDRLVIADPGSGVLDFGAAQNFTITGWFKASKSLSSTDQAIVGKGFSGSGPGYGIRVTNDVSCWVGNGSTTAEPTYTNIIPNTWYHIACVRSGTTLSIYINGQLANSSTNVIIDDDLSNANSLCIGMRSAGCTTNEFGGLIDDLKIYSKALSAQDIAKLYSLGGSKVNVASDSLTVGMNNGPVAWWTFDGKDMIGNIADKTGRGNTGYLDLGSLGNVSTTSILIPGKIGQGIHLDGEDDNITFKDSSDMDGGSNFSACGWFYLSNFRQPGYVMRQAKTGDHSQYVWSISYETGTINLVTAAIQYNGGSSATAIASVSSNPAATRNSWHQACLLFDTSAVASNRLRLVLDGGNVIGTTGSTITTAMDDGDLTLIPSSSYVDDIRLYSRTLSISEVRKLYSQGLSKVNTAHSGIPSSNQDAGINKGLTVRWTFDGKTIVSAIAAVFGGIGTSTQYTMSGVTPSIFFSQGKIGQGFNFDGINDTLSTINNVNANFDISTDPATWCTWVKPLRIPANSSSTMLSKHSTNVNGYQLFQEDAASVSGRKNVFTVLVMDSADTDEARIESAAGAATPYQWTHVCFTYEPGSASGLRLYINGVEDANSPVSLSSISSISNGTTNTFRLGSNSGATNGFFKGVLDDVRFYRSRLLSSDEIRQIYNEGAK